MRQIPYDRLAAVFYAHRWAYGRNPMFYDYEKIGGDCTNFASQCLYAGAPVMNFARDMGWYYLDANNKSPSWTGVAYFYNFLTRKEASIGPIARETEAAALRPGDFAQISFNGEDWQHTPIVVSVGTPGDLSRILVAAHSYDADFRPLDSYDAKKLRFLHVIGAWVP